LDPRDGELVAARSAIVLAHLPRDREGGLLRELVAQIEELGTHVLHEGDALTVAGAVAQDQEADLPRGALLVDPALEAHLASLVRAELSDADGRCHGRLASFRGITSRR